MNPEILAYKYKDIAIGEFNWNGHKHELVKEIKITIKQHIQIELIKNVLHFDITNRTGFSAKANIISDDFNEGPYIDILSYSFKPQEKDKYCLVSDSSGSTQARKYSFQIMENNSLTLGGNGSGGQLNTQRSTMRSYSNSIEEFEKKVNRQGDKEIVSYNMSLCKNEKNIPIAYEVNDLSKLRCSRSWERFGIEIISSSITPALFDIVDIFVPCPDTVYKVPECATSSFEGNWKLEYKSLQQQLQDIEFELSTEVRTVFASNDSRVAKPHCKGEWLNWIKTVHKVTQRFLVKIDPQNQSVSLVLKKRKFKIISAIGYECKKPNQIIRIYPDLVNNKRRIDSLAPEDVEKLLTIRI